jgi:hypothetical protein
MKQANMKIINANESTFDQLELNRNNNQESGTLSSDAIQFKEIFYMPSTIAFKDYDGSRYIQNSVQNIFNNATQNIEAHGYAVIIIHPQDFMKIDANGSPTKSLDQNQINDLSSLIDLILSNNIHVGFFSEIVQDRD